MTKEARNPNDLNGEPRRKYDLEQRTTLFAEAIIDFAKRVAISAITEPLVKQLVRSGTSIGANYAEADDAESKKGFRYRIGICKRESRDTKYWLRMIAHASPATTDEARMHWLEAKELHLIFAAIYRGKTKARNPKVEDPPSRDERSTKSE